VLSNRNTKESVHRLTTFMASSIAEDIIDSLKIGSASKLNWSSIINDWIEILFTSGILVVSILVPYGAKLWWSLSWDLTLFLILYTLILCAVAISVGKGSVTCTSDTVSSSPYSFRNSFSKIKNYFTFFPITHFIRPSDVARENRKLEESVSSLPQSQDMDELNERINYQRDIIIESLLEEYIFPWYTSISDEKTFPEHCRIILQSFFHQLGERLLKVINY